MQIKYFAYGSNLDLAQMKIRCPSSELISKGSLSGYRLTFNRYSSGWGGGVADVIQDQDSKVWGLVFKLSNSDLKRLDSYEGCYNDQTSLYERWKAVINTPKGQISDVWVYTVVEKQKFVQPTLEYLQIIKDAAVRWNFPKITEDEAWQYAIGSSTLEFSCVHQGLAWLLVQSSLHIGVSKPYKNPNVVTLTLKITLQLT